MQGVLEYFRRACYYVAPLRMSANTRFQCALLRSLTLTRAMLQAQRFRDQVAALRAKHDSQEDTAELLASLHADERATGVAVSQQDFGRFLKHHQHKRGRENGISDAHYGASAAAAGSGKSVRKQSRGAHTARVHKAAHVSDTGSKTTKRQRTSDTEDHDANAHAASTGAASSAYKKAVCDVVKAELASALSRGSISKEQFKSIARRATEKVVASAQVWFHTSPCALVTCCADSLLARRIGTVEICIAR